MPGFVEHCNRIVRWGLLGLIVFTPLAFGTVEDWSIAIMEWGIVTLFLIFMAGRLWPGDGPRRSGIWRTGLEWIFALFLLFCVAQTVPLPRALLSVISPGSDRVYTTPHPARGEPTDAFAPIIESGPTDQHRSDQPSKEKRPISVRPDRTLQSTRLAAAFMLLFLLIAWWADRGERIIYLVSAIAIVGFLVAVLSLIQFMTRSGEILWLRPATGDRGFGPFVNHNHFAGYVEMIIPLAIGLSIYLFDRHRQPLSRGREVDGEHENVGSSGTARLLAGHQEKGFLALFAAVILVVSLFFSMSRGGILSTLVSAVILLVLLWDRMLSKKVAWAIALCLPLLVVTLVFWIGPDDLFEHIGSYDEGIAREASFRSRALIWWAMIRGVRQFAWAGSGLGTFEESFAPFILAGAPARWHRAHNDYLQLLWETGAIGITLLLLAAYLFGRRYWWPTVRTRAHPLDVIRIGAAISLMSIAVHSLVDFNLQVGSNGFLFSLLAGLLAALSRASESSSFAGRPEVARAGDET